MSESRVYDAAIVGAGPGGSSAANVLVRAGLSAIQFDARPFPRVKPCAGGLTFKSVSAAPLDLSSTLVGQAPSFEFAAWKGVAIRFNQPGSVLQFVYRPGFDNWFVDQNSKHESFCFHANEAVKSIEYDGLFEIRTSKRIVRAKHLIGADGSYSQVNRTFDLARPRGRATAVEVVLPHNRIRNTVNGIPRFDFGYIEKGYGWLFPKNDHVSVGLYTLAENLKDVRGELRRYIDEKGITVIGDPLDSFEAHRYPVGGDRLRKPDCPVFLVGDAAGFAEAVVGEGIYYALESGRLAGRAIAAGRTPMEGLSFYYRRLKAGVLLDCYLSWNVARIFYQDPRKWLWRLRSPFLWRPLVEGYSRGASLSRCAVLAPFYFWGSWSQRRSWIETL